MREDGDDALDAVVAAPGHVLVAGPEEGRVAVASHGGGAVEYEAGIFEAEGVLEFCPEAGVGVVEEEGVGCGVGAGGRGG